MNFILAIIDSLAGFVQRNPLTTLLIVILALGAPALLKGIALFIMYFFMGLVILAVVLMLAFRWRIYRVRKQMEEQFGEGFGDQAQGGFRQRNSGSPFADRERRDRRRGAGAPDRRDPRETCVEGRGRLRRFRGGKGTVAAC